MSAYIHACMSAFYVVYQSVYIHMSKTIAFIVNFYRLLLICVCATWCCFYRLFVYMYNKIIRRLTKCT